MSDFDDVIFGRMGVGMGGDESEFDFAARNESDLTPEQAEYLFAGDDVYATPPAATRVPPAAKPLRASANPALAAALADAKARQDAVRAALEAEAWRRVLGLPYMPPGSAAAAATPTSPDDGSSYASDDQSSAASDALQRFRQTGVDPFDEEDAAADDMLGALLDAGGDIADAAADLERGSGSAHRGAAYLQQITYPPHGASSGQEGGSVEIDDDTIEVLGHFGFGGKR
jgi:hypothetical protein